MRYPSAAGGGQASSGCYNNCTAIVLSIAILLSGLRVASGAPSGEVKWWKNPCSKHNVRHSRSTAENQLNRSLEHMNATFLKDIRDMYKFTENEKLKVKCPKIKNLSVPIRQASSLHLANKAFYDALVQFAEFIDKLKDTPVNAKGNFDVERRRKNFEQAEGNLRLLMCEYNDTINQYEMKNMNRQNAVMVSKKTKSTKNKGGPPTINKDCLPATMDQSLAHFVDVGFFNIFQKFLKQSRRILQKKKKKGVNKQNRGKSVGVTKKNKRGKRTKKMNL